MLLLAVSDGEPVACGGLQRLDDRTAEIKRMWVHEDWRGAGLGGRMLRALEQAAVDRGHAVVRLDTNSVLTDAVAMYRRAGYTAIDRYNDNPYAHHWFEKTARPETGRRVPADLREDPGVLESVQRGVGSLARGLTSAVTPRFRPGDLDNRDPDFMREVLPATWLFVSAWFRPDIRGLHHIPGDGPVLVVGNHTGGASSPEVHISQLAISTYFGVERLHYQLAHRMVLNSRSVPCCAASARSRPTRTTPPRRSTPAPSSRSSPAATTRSTGRAGSRPASTWVVARASSGWRSRRTSRSCRWSRWADRRRRCSCPGAKDSRGCLGSTQAMRLKSLPIMLALPFGLQIGPLPHFPLPAKVTMRLLAPINLRERYGEDPDVDEIYDDLVATMQQTLTALQHDRRLPVIG